MIPYFEWRVIPLGPISLQVWGLFVSLGAALALFIAVRRAKRFGLRPDYLLDAGLWMIAAGFLFARLFHIFLYEPAYYLAQPLEMLKIWHGGLSSFGGLAGATAGFFCYAWKRGFSVEMKWRVADVLAFGAVFGWMLGRVGCVMIHDHPGVLCPTCFLAIRTREGSARLDMALVEIVAMIPLALAFFLARRRTHREGWFVSILFMYYGVLRFILDFFRAMDLAGADTRYFGLTPAQYGGILLLALGIFIFFRKK